MPTRKPNPWRAYYLGGKKRRELGIRVRRRPGRGPGARAHEIPEASRNRIVVEPE